MVAARSRWNGARWTAGPGPADTNRSGAWDAGGVSHLRTHLRPWPWRRRDEIGTSAGGAARPGAVRPGPARPGLSDLTAVHTPAPDATTPPDVRR